MVSCNRCAAPQPQRPASYLCTFDVCTLHRTTFKTASNPQQRPLRYHTKPTTSACKGVARCIASFANTVKNVACEAFVWYMVASFSHAWARLLTCTQLLVSCNRGTNWFQGNAAMTASHTAGLAAWIRLASAHMALHRLSSSGIANICTIAGRPADCATLSCMNHGITSANRDIYPSVKSPGGKTLLA